MNWYKRAQNKPISLGSYIGNKFDIYFNGRGPYSYIGEPWEYEQIDWWLKSNKKYKYKQVKSILDKIAEKNKKIENKQKQLF